ncbi:MAG: CPBP family intramembrane glutamic endopeptidase, partial [Myxococcota bacterium]
DIGEQVRASVEPSLLGIAPRTPVEHRRFVALSFTAGICEELAYRGVALGLVAEAIGMPIAALATTLAFGLSHAYQGARGIVRTGAVGLVFVGITLGSGSLLLAMTVHALVDVFQGRLLSAAVTPGRDG